MQTMPKAISINEICPQGQRDKTSNDCVTSTHGFALTMINGKHANLDLNKFYNCLLVSVNNSTPYHLSTAVR